MQADVCQRHAPRYGCRCANKRDLIRERTGAGRIAAQARGVRFGRPLKLNDQQRSLALRLLKEGKSVNEVAKTFKVHRVTIYRLVAEPARA